MSMFFTSLRGWLVVNSPTSRHLKEDTPFDSKRKMDLNSLIYDQPTAQICPAAEFCGQKLHFERSNKFLPIDVITHHRETRHNKTIRHKKSHRETLL